MIGLKPLLKIIKQAVHFPQQCSHYFVYPVYIRVTRKISFNMSLVIAAQRKC